MDPFEHLPEGVEPFKTQYIEFIRSRLVLEYHRKSGICRHHIWPVAFGAPRSYKIYPQNIIVLTNHDHWWAHYYLWKAFGGSMATAFWFMTNVNKLHNLKDCELAAQEYAQLKEDYGKTSKSIASREKHRQSQLKYLETHEPNRKGAKLGHPSPCKGKSNKNKGMIHIYDSNGFISIDPKDFSKYENLGYKKGSGPGHSCPWKGKHGHSCPWKGKPSGESHPSPHKGKICIHKGIKITYIFLNELKSYKKLGYSEGMRNKG